MDFVDFWKAASVVFTGFFAALGLLTEFRDGSTKRITAWGRIAVVGTIVSTSAGLIAQIKDSAE